MTWQSQWWWLDYHIDLAAQQLHKEAWARYLSARRAVLGPKDSGAKRRVNVPDHAKA